MSPSRRDIESVELWVGAAIFVPATEDNPFSIHTKQSYVYCATHAGSCAHFGVKVHLKLADLNCKIIAFSGVSLARKLKRIPRELTALIVDADNDEWVCGDNDEDEQDVYLSSFFTLPAGGD